MLKGTDRARCHHVAPARIQARCQICQIEDVTKEQLSTGGSVTAVVHCLRFALAHEDRPEPAAILRRGVRPHDAADAAVAIEYIVARPPQTFLRAAGASDEKIVSSFRAAAKNLAADTVNRIEKRERRKLSDNEIADISDKFSAIYSDFYSANLLGNRIAAEGP